MATQIKMLKCHIWKALLNWCEAWTINGEMKKKHASTETWLMTRFLRVSSIKKIRNEELLELAQKGPHWVKQSYHTNFDPLALYA